MFEAICAELDRAPLNIPVNDEAVTIPVECIFPRTDNFYDLGQSGLRWDDVRATNGTIQTSD